MAQRTVLIKRLGQGWRRVPLSEFRVERAEKVFQRRRLKLWGKRRRVWEEVRVPRAEPVVEVPEIVEEIVEEILYGRVIGGYYMDEASPPGNYRVVLYQGLPGILLAESRMKEILREELDYFHLEMRDYRKARAVAEAMIEGGRWAGEDEEVDEMELPLGYRWGTTYVELVIRDYVYGWPSHAA